ncbi:MAG: PIN domain-containing protein [Nanoarchaeota archaeon]
MKQRKDGNKSLFYDTYAILGILKGDPAYTGYTKSIHILTTIMNLYKAYFILLRERDTTAANIAIERFHQYCVPIYPQAIKEAARFKLAHSTDNISYVDAIGYVLAKHHHVQFLTGDKAFKNLPNVRFVK